MTFDGRQQPGKYVARLLAGEPEPYVPVADTLDELHASAKFTLIYQSFKAESRRDPTTSALIHTRATPWSD